MNNHDNIRKQLSAYAGGDLEPSERIRMEEHLAECATCRAELADLQTVLRLMGTTPELEPPAWLATRTMARVQQQREKRSWLQRIFIPLHVKLPFEVAALLLVCVSGYYMARTLETELKQPAGQGETPAGTQQTSQPAAAPGQKAVPVRPSLPALPAPVVGKVPGSEAVITAQPPAPKAANRIAPHSTPESPDKSGPQPAFAPAPPAMKDDLKTQTAEPTNESARPSPGNQPHVLSGRAQPAAEELKKKARRADEQDKAVSERLRGAAAGVVQPQATIRLSVASPATAPGSLRDAVIRSGGSVIDSGSARQNTLRAHIPATRMNELLELLSHLGTLVERPRAWAAAGNVEIEIIW